MVSDGPIVKGGQKLKVSTNYIFLWKQNSLQKADQVQVGNGLT